MDNTTHPLKWIFFDVGETLVDESEPIEDITRQLIAAAGRRGIAVRREQVRELWMEAHRRFSPFPMADILQELFPDGELRRAIWSEMKYRKELDRPFPDALGILKRLRRDYRIGIIANQSAGTADRLRSYGLLEHIDEVFASAELGLAKPDPKLYEYALQATGCPPERSLMVGDRIDNDIVPAKHLGMRAVWVRQGLALRQYSPSRISLPDGVIDVIGELEGWLASWRPAPDESLPPR
ncbi:HAD family hydrolase [Paenibacillus pasadenensis]|uniref:HAD family hydrolase n=1 Tax=Paenibacillus TaxID=44249 RepID=UPI000410FA3C|nr:MULTISPECIES: HAD family hydrolase [Paenibacillus]QGG56500.1 HAD-IA family hydrolase [Paenibacillus sp. B01]